MSYRKQLKAWFGHLPLEVDDLLLLERFELLALPQRAPLRPLGVVLAADHRLRRFIEVRCPELATWLGEIVEDAAGDTGDLAEHQRAVVWELADWLVYQRFPEAYDGVDALRWDASQLGDVCEIEGRTVVDAGAGTGWLSEALAHRAKAVFAVEPVGRLREHIRRRAAAAGQDNLYAVDGFLHRIPPAGGLCRRARNLASDRVAARGRADRGRARGRPGRVGGPLLGGPCGRAW